MPRNMSFALTIPQMRAKTKTVTRRMGWWNLKPGTLLWAVEKGMGLKAGETVQRIGLICVVDVRPVRLGPLDPAEVAAEGFPGWTPEEFISFFCKKNGTQPATVVNRIEFRHMRLNPAMPIPVPEKLAKCPICEGKLFIVDCPAREEAEPGLMKPTELQTECEHEPDIEADDWVEWHAFHYATPYIDWLPVDTRVLKWFQRVCRYVRD